MKNNYLFAILLFIRASASFSQSPDWSWAINSLGYSYDGANAVVTDQAGNVIITGYFYGQSVNIGTMTLYNADPSGNKSDMFVAKFDREGLLLWAERAGGNNEDGGYDVTTDASGNVYVTGDFYSSSIMFGTITLTNNGDYDMFLVKYDPSGNVVWAKSAGRGSDDYGRTLIADDSGNLYVGGGFRSPTMNFGSYSLMNTDQSGFTYDMFITKYSSQGAVIWSKSYGGGQDEYLRSLSFDSSGNVVAAGHFNSPTINIGSIALNSVGSFDIFLLKNDPAGTELWANAEGGSSIDYCNGITVSPDGGIYITGASDSPSLTLDSISISIPSTAMYIAKYNSSGNIIWAKGQVGGNGQGVAADSSGNVFVTGYFGFGNPTFYLDTMLLQNEGDYDIFLAAYRPTGSFLWAKGIGNTSEEEAFSVAVHGSETYLAGRFASNTLQFSSFELNNYGADDAFLAKIDSKNIIGIKENVLQDNFTIFPNPFSYQTTILCSAMNNNSKVTILNLIGEVVHEIRISGTEYILDRGDMPVGIYFVRMTDSKGQLLVKKIVVQ